jgi:prepilin-type N-terminal cleavage/methylation domain-containing protein
VEGKANEALLAFLAGKLSLRQNELELARGAKSREKQVSIPGKSSAEVLAALGLGARAGFSLIELLIVVAIVGLLAGLAGTVYSRALASAAKTESLSKLRTMGQGILLYSGDHDNQLPGPLWPGQVMLYDKNREGRLVRELAEYLSIEQRDTPYVVEDRVPSAYKQAMRGANLGDVRVYVMNSAIVREGETLAPFGSLTGTSPVPAMRMAALGGLPEGDRWMMSEADQLQPDVAAAVWRANTPAKPVYVNRRAVLYFDGSAEFEAVGP